VIGGVRCRVRYTQRLKYHSPNPKKGAAYERYGRYMHATTVEEARASGGAIGDLTHDAKVGLLQWNKLAAMPIPKQVALAAVIRTVKSRIKDTAKRAQKSKASCVLCRKRRRQLDELQADVKKKRQRLDVGARQHAGSHLNPKTCMPHMYRSGEPDYRIAVLSYPHAKRVDCLQTHTLAFLRGQRVPWSRVHLIVATEEEKKRYAASLGSDAEEMEILVVGKPGIVEARNFMVSYFPADTHVVSLDDDVMQVHHGGRMAGTDLPAKGLQGIIHHADGLMKEQEAFIWGLNPSDNDRNSNPNISRKNGIISGHVYGFINRPSITSLLPSLGQAAEDCERSVRYFNHDKIVLRYMMYCVLSRTYWNPGGIQETYRTQAIRKAAENGHVERLQREFPALIGLDAKKQVQTVNATFNSQVGLSPLQADGNGWWS